MERVYFSINESAAGETGRYLVGGHYEKNC